MGVVVRRGLSLLVGALLVAGCTSGGAASSVPAPTYRAVASSVLYVGAYTIGGNPPVRSLLLSWTRHGATASGTLQVLAESVVSDAAGLGAGGTYSARVTFSATSLTVVVSAPNGFHESVPGRLDGQGVLLNFPGYEGGFVPAQFVSLPAGQHGSNPRY